MRRVGLLFLLVGASACASRTPAPVATAPVQAAPAPPVAQPPAPVDPVAQAVATAEAAFEAGRAASQQGHLKDARLAFDLALDTLLVMPGGARSDPRLSAAVDALTDRISALELATLSSGDGFTETATEPASIDTLLSLPPAEADVAVGNVASARVLEKLGFQREGLLREDRPVGGAFVDHWRYGLLTQEFR